MTAELFEIATEPSRHLIHIVMRGQWTVETVEDYRQATLAAVKKMLAAGCASGSILALVDARDLGAQSQQVIASYKDRLDASGLVPQRLATLVSSTLFKRQVERIAIPNQRLFTDEVEAFAWLLGPPD